MRYPRGVPEGVSASDSGKTRKRQQPHGTRENQVKEGHYGAGYSCPIRLRKMCPHEGAACRLLCLRRRRFALPNGCLASCARLKELPVTQGQMGTILLRRQTRVLSCITQRPVYSCLYVIVVLSNIAAVLYNVSLSTGPRRESGGCM